MSKYQQDNPNNCSVTIDYKDKINPVKFQYVGNKTPFKVCYNLIRYKLYQYYLLLFVFLSGICFAYIIKFSYFTKDYNLKIALYYMLGFYVVYMLFFYVFPAIFGYIMSKTKLIKLAPFMWTSGKTRYYTEFKPENVIDNKIEIPCYRNMFLHYQLFDDFKEHIDKIEVLPHPFTMITKKSSLFGKTKRELNPNEYIWKATFYFNQKINHGIMKVEFT